MKNNNLESKIGDNLEEETYSVKKFLINELKKSSKNIMYSGFSTGIYVATNMIYALPSYAVKCFMGENIETKQKENIKLTKREEKFSRLIDKQKYDIGTVVSWMGTMFGIGYLSLNTEDGFYIPLITNSISLLYELGNGVKNKYISEKTKYEKNHKEKNRSKIELP